MVQVGREHPFGDEEEASVGGELPLEAHVPADLPAQRPALFLCNAPRDGAGGNAARLQHDDTPGIDEAGWYPRRLAGTGRGYQDRRAMAGQRRPNRLDVIVDGERGERHELRKRWR